MTNMNILVTGGNGFIGSKIIDRLVSQGFETSLILRKNNNRKRLSHLLDKIQIREGDLTQPEDVINILKEINPEIIIHLAGYGVYSYSDMSQANVELMINSNINATINLLYAAQNTSCKIFINTGSCFEYGNSGEPFNEQSLLSPVNIYGVTKASATLFAQVFSKKSNFSLVTLRPFTAYGPFEDERRFISTIIRQCLQGKNPTLTSQKIVRDYIFIDDIVDAYLKALELGEKLSGQIINISTGKGTALEDVARMIIRLTSTEVSPDIGSFPLREGEVLSLVGNATKAKKLLNWKARYPLEEGISKTIEWVRNDLKQ